MKNVVELPLYLMLGAIMGAHDGHTILTCEDLMFCKNILNIKLKKIAGDNDDIFICKTTFKNAQERDANLKKYHEISDCFGAKPMFMQETTDEQIKAIKEKFKHLDNYKAQSEGAEGFGDENGLWAEIESLHLMDNFTEFENERLKGFSQEDKKILEQMLKDIEFYKYFFDASAMANKKQFVYNYCINKLTNYIVENNKNLNAQSVQTALIETFKTHDKFGFIDANLGFLYGINNFKKINVKRTTEQLIDGFNIGIGKYQPHEKNKA